MPRIGIDIGGTFTDLVLADGDDVVTRKVPSTPNDPSIGAIDAVKAANVNPESIEVFDHGTTVATNIIIERNPGTRVVFLTNDGFDDIPEIMRTDRENQYDRQWVKPEPLVPRPDRHGVSGRMTVEGMEHRPLDEKAAEAIVRSYAETDENVSYAISMLYSFLDSRHEERLVSLVEELHPDASVSASHDVFPQAKEYERASTVIANAYVKPKMRRYLRHLKDRLEDIGCTAVLNIMQSNGGLLPVDEVTRTPAKTLFSGPAGGIAGATHYGTAVSDDLITLDMGGTSTDVGIVRDGEPLLTTEGEISWGLPVQFPQADIEAVGAGGGSIAWIDSGGLLKVGPQSAGADPGPVCYGQGGTEPTVTDANLVLGRLNPNNFIGGDMRLNVDAAREAIAELGDKLGMGVTETALGILEIGMNTLTQAIRTVTVERGYDPREFSLVAFGGAGPMHAPSVMQLANIPRTVVPPNSGVLSAAGMITTDFKYDQLQSFIQPLDDFDKVSLRDLNETLEGMATDGMSVIGEQNEFVTGISVQLSADLRYAEQAYEVGVPLSDDIPVLESDLNDAEQRFHDKHEQLYGHSNVADTVEMVNVHVDIIGQRPIPDALSPERPEVTGNATPPEDTVKETRRVTFTGGERETTVYDREALVPGNELSGPFIIEEDQSTIVGLPSQTATVNDSMNVVIEEVDG